MYIVYIFCILYILYVLYILGGDSTGFSHVALKQFRKELGTSSIAEQSTASLRVELPWGAALCWTGDSKRVVKYEQLFKTNMIEHKLRYIYIYIYIYIVYMIIHFVYFHIFI